MSKCICKQIADLAEKNGCNEIHVCTNHAGICGYVDVDATKDADGILVLNNAKIKYNCHEQSEVKSVDSIGIGGLHIVAVHCDKFEI